MKQLKRMQGLLTDNLEEKPRLSHDKFRTVPKLSKQKTNAAGGGLPALKLQKETKSSKSLVVQKKDAPAKKVLSAKKAASENKLTDRGVQTERPQDVAKLYEKGTIIYPRKQEQKRAKRKQDHGDSLSREQIDGVTDKMENMEVEEKNYIRENIQALKQQSPKHDKDENDKLKLPKNYQKGVVPKYLKNKKDDKQAECDPECPPGHVLLPDEERKETLRVLRQSSFVFTKIACFHCCYYTFVAGYADRIQELNSMPVRNDTLRMRKRKMEIEEELKKIDEGIKVFQRPKVFVKINA